MRVDALQAGALRRKAYEIADGLPGEGLATLGQEQPGQLVLPGGEIAPDRTQLVAGDRLDTGGEFGSLAGLATLGDFQPGV